MQPDPVSFALPCPACHEPLDEDHDGTSCDHCGGLLVPRVWADRCLPAMGRPALPPVFLSAPKVMACPGCRRAMAAVLCHGVSSWSCPQCRWLFFEGLRRSELRGDPSRSLAALAQAPVIGPATTTATTTGRSIPRASLLAVFTANAARASVTVRDALGLFVLAALVVAAIVLEGRF